MKLNDIKAKVDKIFEDMWGESPFYKMVSAWQDKGVVWYEIDNAKMHAITKHNNSYEYPEKCYVMKMDDEGNVKYFEITHRNSDWASEAKEITEEDFAISVIPVETNPNIDVRDKVDHTEQQIKDIENIAPKEAEGFQLRKDKYEV